MGNKGVEPKPACTDCYCRCSNCPEGGSVLEIDGEIYLQPNTIGECRTRELIDMGVAPEIARTVLVKGERII